MLTTHFCKNRINRFQSRFACVLDMGPDFNLRFSILSEKDHLQHNIQHRKDQLFEIFRISWNVFSLHFLSLHAMSSLYGQKLVRYKRSFLRTDYLLVIPMTALMSLHEMILVA